MQARGEGKDSGGRSAADAETLERIAAERFTCRAYLPDAVPTDVIERVVEIAKRAASWCNVQPWHAIVTSRDTTERFRAALVAHAAQHPGIYADMPFPDEYRGVYGERRREVGYGSMRRSASRAATACARAAGCRELSAVRCAACRVADDPGRTGTVRGARLRRVRRVVLLAARAHGVATTAQAALAHHARFIRRYFGIGDERRFVCGIAFGYADMTHPANAFRSTRAATADVMQMV